ncbi:MAG: hypothetical protein RJB60_1134 [Pseudomonadota bacterium]
MRRLKSGSWAAFFLSPSWFRAGAVALFGGLCWAWMPAKAQDAVVPRLVAQAQALRLHQDPVWAALLHVQQGMPSTQDPHFILTLGHFSVEAELHATLEHLYGGAVPNAVCRFPARHAWIRKHLPQAPDLPLLACADLNEFMRRVPFEQVSLVYASENLSQPSSMMGHLFLKVAGAHSQGQSVEHAIAFFTDVDTYNLPKLMLDSLVLGMPGHFALSPYEDEVNTYVRKEQRSLWEYELKLDDFNRELLRLHLIELKQTTFTYYFHRYNCATLVKHVLALAAPRVLDVPDFITTPKDVIKLADAAGVIANTSVKTPARWRVRAMAQSLSAERAEAVRLAVLDRQPEKLAPPIASESPDAEAVYIQLALAEAYNDHLLINHALGLDDWRVFQQHVQARQRHAFEGYSMQASETKNPLRSPQDMQASMGVAHRQGRSVVRLGFLPVSHTLADDNGTYFSENELRLFDLAVDLDPQRGQLRLDRLTVYSAQSLLPREPFTGGLSGRFKLGFERQSGTELSDKMGLVIDCGLGVDARPVRDVDLFALLGIGWRWQGQGQVHLAPSVGVVMREVYRMKSIVTLTRRQALLQPSEAVNEVVFTQSVGIDAHTTLQLQATHRRDQNGLRQRVGELQLKRIF